MPRDSISSSKKKQYKSDRHLNKKDRHKQNTNRHLYKDDGHPCICGYAKCPELEEGFHGTDHIYDRAPIRLTISDDESWGVFFESLLRNLHVTDEMRAKLVTEEKGYRFSVAAHHFTEDVVRFFWNGHKHGVFKVRMDRTEASRVLHLPLDTRDKDGMGNSLSMQTILS